MVLPKKLRESYNVQTGDEAVIVAVGDKMSLHLHKASEDPLADLTALSQEISIGLSAEQLKKKSEEERLKHFLQT